jgi:hypothetical protein
LHHSVSTKVTASADAAAFLQAIGFHAGAPGHKWFGERDSTAGHYEWPTETRGVLNSMQVSLREVSEGWTVLLYWTRPEIPGP